MCAKERRIFSKSNRNCMYDVIFIISLTTCFDPSAGPSLGRKIYKEEKPYNVSHKMWYIIKNSTRSRWILEISLSLNDNEISSLKDKRSRWILEISLSLNYNEVSLNFRDLVVTELQRDLVVERQRGLVEL
jgi:hypothetical protein